MRFVSDQLTLMVKKLSMPPCFKSWGTGKDDSLA
jgi:hypothetical protein